MRVDCALLCDAATVRDGLLHVLGGGVTRVAPAAYPSPLGLALALRILVHTTETDRAHECRVLLQGEDGQSIADARFAFGANPNAAAAVTPGEELPLALPLHLEQVEIPRPGAYSLELLLDGVHQVSVPFRAAPVPKPERKAAPDDDEA